jgi:hypothetical protein
MNVDRLCLAGHSLSDVESHSLVPATLSSLTDHVGRGIDDKHTDCPHASPCGVRVVGTV